MMACSTNLTIYILSLADRHCPLYIYIQLYHICASDADNLFVGYSTRVSTGNIFYTVSKLPVIMCSNDPSLLFFFNNVETSNMSSLHLTILLSLEKFAQPLYAISVYHGLLLAL